MRGKSRAGLTSGVLGLGLSRLRPAAEASQSLTKVVLCRRGARARAKDKGLLWLYLLYKVRAQLISQAA